MGTLPPTQPPGYGTRSPDGRWWWDGHQWQFVQQAQQSSQKPPGNPWVAVGVVVAIVVMGVWVAALANAGGQQRTAAISTPGTGAAKATATPTAAPREGSCSPQPCANDNYGWIVVVTNMKYDAKSPNQFDRPEAGNIYVTLDVTFTNKLASEQHANSLQFVLQDGAGIKHSTTFATVCESWSPVNVTPGASYGPKCLVFQAAADKPHGLTLVWTPHFGGGDYRIKLT